MRLQWENAAISTVYYFVFFTAPLNSKAPLFDKTPLPGGIVATPFKLTPLGGITSTDYTTIFEYKRTLEDIGSLEMLNIFFAITFICAGHGYIRFQLAGDGGPVDSSFTTIAEADFNYPYPYPNPQPAPIPQEPPTHLPAHDIFYGSGLWLPFIESGDNKLVIRCQVKTVDPIDTPVDTWIYDTNFDDGIDSELDIVYRKKVLF
jgi:hypothetical protein